MKTELASALLALSLAASLAACGNAASAVDSTSASASATVSDVTSLVDAVTTTPLTATVTEKGGGISITADHATVATPEAMGTITVDEGDSIAYVSRLDEGVVHVTVSSVDAGKVVSDRDGEAGVFFTDLADPGTYAVTATAKGATGTIYVAAADENEISQILEQLLTPEAR